MLNYILGGGIVTSMNFFTPEKFESIKQDIKTLNWEPTHQPLKMEYGNRFQGMPCYQTVYDKENDYIITGIEEILNNPIKDFNMIARKILISEIKASTQDFSKYDEPAIKIQESTPVIEPKSIETTDKEGEKAFSTVDSNSTEVVEEVKDSTIEKPVVEALEAPKVNVEADVVEEIQNTKQNFPK